MIEPSDQAVDQDSGGTHEFLDRQVISLKTLRSPLMTFSGELTVVWYEGRVRKQRLHGHDHRLRQEGVSLPQVSAGSQVLYLRWTWRWQEMDLDKDTDIELVEVLNIDLYKNIENDIKKSCKRAQARTLTSTLKGSQNTLGTQTKKKWQFVYGLDGLI